MKTFTESRPYEWDAYFGRQRRAAALEAHGSATVAAAGSTQGGPERTTSTEEAAMHARRGESPRHAVRPSRDRELADRAALRRARVESFFSVWGEK